MCCLMIGSKSSSEVYGNLGTLGNFLKQLGGLIGQDTTIMFLSY